MTLAELTAAVVLKTNRPDQVDAIQQAILEATLWAHMYDFWRRDLQLVTYNNTSSPTYAGSLDLTSLPGFRKISFWRKLQTVGDLSTLGDYLNFVEPDKMFDEYNCKKTDVFYLAGLSLKYFSSTIDSYFYIGYWIRPSLILGSYNSWLADYMPFVIINYASGIIFDDVGQVEVGNQKRRLAQMALEELKVNEIEVVGR